MENSLHSASSLTANHIHRGGDDSWRHTTCYGACAAALEAAIQEKMGGISSVSHTKWHAFP